MSDTSSEIHERIEGYHQRLEQDLSDLKSQVDDNTNWRKLYDKHPMWFVGAAFGSGVVLSAMLSGGSRPAAVKVDGPRDYTVARKSALEQMLDDVKTTLIAFATMKAREGLAQAFPSLREHIRRNEGFGRARGI